MTANIFGVVASLLFFSIVSPTSSSKFIIEPAQRDSCLRKVEVAQIWDSPCWLSVHEVEADFLGQPIDDNGSPKHIVRYGADFVGTIDVGTRKVRPLPGFRKYDPAAGTGGEILFLPPGSVDYVQYMTESGTSGGVSLPNGLVATSKKDPTTGESYDPRFICKAHPENGWAEGTFEPLGITRQEGGLQYCQLRNRKTKKIHKHDRMEILVNRYQIGSGSRSQAFPRCPSVPVPPRPAVCDFLETVYQGAEKALSSGSVTSSKLRLVLEKIITVAHTAWT